MRRLFYLLPVLIFGGLAGYFAVGLTLDPSRIPSMLIDKPAPAFDLPAVPGRILRDGASPDGLATADLAGGDGPTLVNVYASWCVPCLVEHPLITRLSADWPVHGIAHKDDAADNLRWLARHGDPYDRVGYDLDGRASIEWGVYGVPETYVLDADGIVRHRHVGPLSAEDVEGEILPLLRRLKREATG